MDFETLKKDNRKKWIIGSIVVILLAVAIFFVSSKANYKVTEKVNIANGTINYSPSDLNLIAIKLQNNSGGYDNANTIPTSGYTLSSSSYCEVDGTKDASIPMEYSNGKVTIGVNKKNTKCYLYFDKQLTPANEYLIAKNEMVVENGYRYEGKTPNNYVTFNNEVWRIIGVFNVENSDTGKTENLVKLIRNESIGNIVWDTYGYVGTNDWTVSDIKTILNGQYYNGENISYTYRKPNNSHISNSSVSITGKSINDAARAMIQNVKWHLGGISIYSEEPVSPSDPRTPSDAEEATASKFYTAERGTTVNSGNKTTWNGYVGLMYPSDYGYAVDATSCARTTALFNYSGTCSSNNWLFNSDSEWPIIPVSSDSYTVFALGNTGSMNAQEADSEDGIRPSVYLKSNVVINGGDGTSSNPYTLSM